jgi:tetratricopeptide (TPR) repeat protein
MTGISTHGTGRFEKAIQASQEGIAENPDLAIAYGNLAESYFLTDRWPEAERIIQRASERRRVDPNLLIVQ